MLNDFSRLKQLLALLAGAVQVTTPEVVEVQPPIPHQKRHQEITVLPLHAELLEKWNALD